MKATLRKATRSILLIAAALVTMVTVSGCGGLGVQEDWLPRATLPALPVAYAEVEASHLIRVCGDHAGMKVYGCAKRDFKARTCTIYTGPTPAVWLLDHERKHCAGFDHGTDNDKLRTAAAFPSQSL